MGNPNDNITLLDMFQYPVFRVEGGIILEVNHIAAAKGIQINTAVAELLPNNEEYSAYSDGCLSITVQAEGVNYIATVMHTDQGDIFHLQSLDESPELQMLTLTAQQLRNPLSEVMTAANTLFDKENIQDKEQIGLINKGLFRLLREIGNMSAVSSYRTGRAYGKENLNVVSIINETMEKAKALCNTSTQRLRYTALNEDIFCSVDAEMVERAVYNLISNAVKFSSANSPIVVKLSAKNSKLSFSVESHPTDPSLTQGNLFMRYVRDASIEDGRHGLGLGIPLIQYTAAAHNGTLLMDHPNKDTVRFTLTLSTFSDREPVLKAPFPAFDYMGGWDHSLVELSDVLPASVYENN